MEDKRHNYVNVYFSKTFLNLLERDGRTPESFIIHAMQFWNIQLNYKPIDKPFFRLKHGYIDPEHEEQAYRDSDIQHLYKDAERLGFNVLPKEE